MIEAPNDLLKEIERLEEEVKLVHDELVIPRWNGHLHGLNQTLYGYVMMTFAHIDRASALWAGSDSTRGQTKRMVHFLDRYLSRNHEANLVAIQMWRHKLMHTARPRLLKNHGTGMTYYWLLHWWRHLPPEQHYTFIDSGDRRILNLGLVYLIEQLRSGITAYLSDVAAAANLRTNFAAVQSRFGAYEISPSAAV